MLSRISLLLVAVALFGMAAGVEAKNNKPQPSAKKNGNGGNNGNNGNNQGNSVGKQIGQQLLQRLVFGNGGFNGNGNNGNNGNCNNGNNGNCHNGNNNCPQGPVVLPQDQQPPVVEEPTTEQPMDTPMNPTDGTMEVGAEEGTDVSTEEGTPGSLKSAGLSKGADLQAKLVAFKTTTVPVATTLTSAKTLTVTKSLTTNKPRRVLVAEIACVGKVAYTGGRTLTIEHDSKPGQQPPTIIAVAKIPAIAAGQVFKFQKELPAGFSLESLRLRMTVSPGDGNAANDTISSKE